MQGSEAVFGKECVGNPCCGTILKHSNGPSLKFSDYKRLCLKWEQAVVAALRTALLSREYVQTRNALLFLSYNSKVYHLPCSPLVIKRVMWVCVCVHPSPYVCQLFLWPVRQVCAGGSLGAG